MVLPINKSIVQPVALYALALSNALRANLGFAVSCPAPFLSSSVGFHTFASSLTTPARHEPRQLLKTPHNSSSPPHRHQGQGHTLPINRCLHLHTQAHGIRP